MARDDDDPRAPYKVYEGEELKRHICKRALKRVEHNSGSPRPNRKRTSLSRTCWKRGREMRASNRRPKSAAVGAGRDRIIRR